MNGSSSIKARNTGKRGSQQSAALRKAIERALTKANAHKIKNMLLVAVVERRVKIHLTM